MNLTEAIYKIEYSIAGEESYDFVDENSDYDRNRLTLYLKPVISSFSTTLSRLTVEKSH